MDPPPEPRAVPPSEPPSAPPSASPPAAPPSASPPAAPHSTSPPAHHSPESSSLLPPLPRGEPLFDSLPGSAVVLEALPAAVGDGAILVWEGGWSALLLVRGGRTVAACCTGPEGRVSGDAAAVAARAAGQRAAVSARRLQPELVDAIAPFLLHGEPRHRDLGLAWTDWHQLIADLGSRDGGGYLVEVSTPAGRGLTIVGGGGSTLELTEDGPWGEADAGIEDLARQPSGSVSVWRLPPAATPAPASAPAVTAAGWSTPAADVSAGPAVEAPVTSASAEPPSLEELLPRLKLVARDRLQLSATRLERKLDEAAARSQPLDSVIDEIRVMSIRGVLPATLEEVAGRMRAVASDRSGVGPAAPRD